MNTGLCAGARKFSSLHNALHGTGGPAAIYLTSTQLACDIELRRISAS
jgi:hypothetical protein